MCNLESTSPLLGGMGFEDCPYRGIPMAEKILGNRRNSLLGSRWVAGQVSSNTNGAVKGLAGGRSIVESRGGSQQHFSKLNIIVK